MKEKNYRYTLEIELPDPCLNSSIMELVDALLKEANRVGCNHSRIKGNAVYLKWLSLSFLKAEIEALDVTYANHSSLRTLDYSLIISKIETFLTQARSILDILAFSLSKSIHSQQGQESINDFRKRKDLPNEFNDYFSETLSFDPEYSLSENGWLTLLLTDHHHHGHSLRDFVVHKGTLKLVHIPQSGGGCRFGFHPREGVTAHAHVWEVLENIHSGLNEFFALVIGYLSKLHEK